MRHSFYQKSSDTVFYTNEREISCDEEVQYCHEDLEPVFPLSISLRKNWEDFFSRVIFIDYEDYDYANLQYQPYSDSSYDGVENFSLKGRGVLFGYGFTVNYFFIEFGLGGLFAYFEYQLSRLICTDENGYGRSCSPGTVSDTKNLKGLTINPFLRFSLVYYESDTWRVSTDMRITRLSDDYQYYALPAYVVYLEGEQYSDLEYRFDDILNKIIAITYYF